MATWTEIPQDALNPDSPARAIDAQALRDNPIAIAEGDASAPRVKTPALEDSAVTTSKIESSERMTTDNVLGVTSEASAGAVGTYAFLGKELPEDTTYATFGDTKPGSELEYAGTGTDGGGTASGTWRCMGHARNSDSTDFKFIATLWLRIS